MDPTAQQTMAPLAKKLDALRGTRTTMQLADQVGWDVAKLSKILRGQRRLRVDELAALLDALVFSPEQSAELRLLYSETEQALDDLRATRRPIRSSMFEGYGQSPVVRAGRVSFESSEEPGRQDIVQYREEVEKDIASNLEGAKRRLIGYHSLRFSALTFTAITPALAAFEAPATLTVVAGCIALLSTGAIQLTRLHERSLVDQRRASALHRQVRMYRTGAGDYATETRDALLVERVEAIREQGDNDRIAVTQQAFETSASPSVPQP